MANENGEVTPNLTKHIIDLVECGVGLIISGHACVHPTGRTAQNQLGARAKVHESEGKIVAQLSHGEAKSNPSVTGEKPMAPSAMPETEGKTASVPASRVMTQKDIDQIVTSFRDAAIRAKKAGYDGVQLHCAHGYLLSEFLSPFFNK
jgi:2,4-dienoyl-CoA reductase-like NADH-dependent reductase (Old Yellow Enzyme family)